MVSDADVLNRIEKRLRKKRGKYANSTDIELMQGY
jgi:hypothetical protein